MDVETPWHYLRPNDALRYPRRVIVFDTEARITETKRGQKHRFRCAAASFDRIDKATLEPARTERQSFTTPQALWEWVTAKAVRKERTFVFAHNLAYDLRVGRAFELLPAGGWTLPFLTLDTQRCVARWVKDGRGLTMTDTTSWLPVALEEIGRRLKRAKAPLPAQGAPAADWLQRCLTDVEITREAALWLLRYLEEGDLGSFRLTGPAQAMGAYRHRFMPKHGLLVHRDEVVLAAEREAAYTGRCEVLRHGRTSARLAEWDFELAYLHLARDLPLPVHLSGYVNRLTTGQLRQRMERCCVLAQCIVTQTEPILPARREGRVLWPVGTFAGTYWDVELQAALGRGAEISVSRAWLYRRRPVLRDWAGWLLDRLSQAQADVPPLEPILLKHWARALIGRFGLRYPDLNRSYRLPYAGIEYVPGVDLDDGSAYAELQVGKDVLEQSGMVESPSSMPAVMSYIMAASRVRLLEAVEAAGWQHTLYVDTDSLLVDYAGSRRLSAWARSAAGAGLRRKRSYTEAVLRGPRSLSLDDELRAAGVPRKATRAGDGRFVGEVWEGLSESLRRGRPNEVLVRPRSFQLRGTDRRRRHLPGGATAPHLLTLDE
jgi:hypothetical protein